MTWCSPIGLLALEKFQSLPPSLWRISLGNQLQDDHEIIKCDCESGIITKQMVWSKRLCCWIQYFSCLFQSGCHLNAEVNPGPFLGPELTTTFPVSPIPGIHVDHHLRLCFDVATRAGGRQALIAAPITSKQLRIRSHCRDKRDHFNWRKEPSVQKTETLVCSCYPASSIHGAAISKVLQAWKKSRITFKKIKSVSPSKSFNLESLTLN